MALIALDERWYETSPFLSLVGRGEKDRPFACPGDVLDSLAGEEQRSWFRRVLENRSGPPERESSLSFAVGGDKYDYRARFIPGNGGPSLLLEKPGQKALSREELDEYERMKTFFQLFKGIIHDVKSKLHFILNNYDYLEDIMPDREDEFTLALQEILDDNREGLQIAYDLVRDTLNYGAYRSDRRGPMDLPSILDKSLSFLDGDLRGIKLDIRFGESRGAVVGTAEKLERVFVNLLLNSIQAFSAGETAERKIRIAGSAGVEGYTIIFEDNGPGMGEEVREKLFRDRFTTKTSDGGTGLGLLFVKDIIEEDMGGKISLSSEPGKGASFRLVLPLSDPGQGEGGP